MCAEGTIAPLRPATTLLFTGFGPFLDVADNVSGRLATLVAERHPLIGPHQVESAVLPVTYDAVASFAATTAGRVDVAAWIALGVGRTPTVRLERCANNRVTSAAPDASGCACAGRTLVPDAAPRLETALPLDRWSATLDAGARRVVVSSDPGGYICNALYYWMLHLVGSRYPVLFIHVPHDLAHTDRVKVADLLAEVAVRAAC